LEALLRLRSTGHELRALLDALLDVATNPLALRLRDKRPETGVLLEGIPYLGRLRNARSDPLDFLEPLARYEHPGQRAAGLTRVQIALRDPVLDRGLEVRVRQD